MLTTTLNETLPRALESEQQVAIQCSQVIPNNILQLLPSISTVCD
jgi:hypothetical protein